MDKKYSVVGYDKDNDYYEKLGDFGCYEDACEALDILDGIIEDHNIRNKLNEPIDWFEVWENWGTKEEKLLYYN